MLTTKNLSYQHPKGPLIKFPDMEVKIDEPILILGESGSGKTTLLHLLAGLLSPTTGTVSIDGQDLSKLSSSAMDRFRGKHIGLVYQRGFFIESLNVHDNLLVSPFSQKGNRLREMSEILRINHLLSKMPKQLSVGEQQRATIARALMTSPKLLLADEPTSALDGRNCEAVSKLLRQQAKANNAALVIVTHDDRLRQDIPNTIELQSLINA